MAEYFGDEGRRVIAGEAALMRAEVGTHGSDPQRLARLRELRAEVQDLQALVAGVRAGETTLKVYADYIRKTRDDITELWRGIEDGDTVRHLVNALEQIDVCPLLTDPEGDFDAQEQLHHLNMLDAQCRRAIFQVGMLTIPERLNGWLANARPGYYVPFHSVFEDELPDREDRVRLLNYLALSPKTIKGGLVDADSGLIYRYSRSRGARWASLVLIVAAFCLATGGVIGACYLPIMGWPLQSRHVSTSLIGWGAVLIGVVVHVAVGTVKRRQAQGGRPPIIAVEDLPLLINAKAGQILLKLLLTLVGFYGLVFTAGADEITPLNAFLVGYSLDSFVGLFGASIEQQAAARATALRQQLGVTADH